MEENNNERIKKGIRFLRQFRNKADKNLYRDAVMRFCDLVEKEMIKPPLSDSDIKEALFIQ